MLAVDDRVVMVSGANRGIGRAMTVGLLARGYRLSLGSRRPRHSTTSQANARWACRTMRSTRQRPAPGSMQRWRASAGSTR